MVTLADIYAPDLRDRVLARVAEHLVNMAITVAPTGDWRLPSPDDMATLRYEVEHLVYCAQGGIGAVREAGGDWPHDGAASAALVEVCHVLYSSAMGGSPDPLALVDAVDPHTELGLVLVAAGARVRLDQRGTLTPRELGVLTGFSAERVRQLIKAGALVADAAGRYAVPAEEARRWLVTRRVLGVEP